MHLWQVILFPSSSHILYGPPGKTSDSFTTVNVFSCGREGRAGGSTSQQKEKEESHWGNMGQKRKWTWIPLNLESHSAQTRDNLPCEGQLPLPAIKHLEFVVCKALAQRTPWEMLRSSGISAAHGMQLGYGSPNTPVVTSTLSLPTVIPPKPNQSHLRLFSAFWGLFSTNVVTQAIPSLLLCRAPSTEPLQRLLQQICICEHTGILHSVNRE